MSVSLPKGANVSLSMARPGLRHVLVGLGWTAGAVRGAPLDLRASVLLAGRDGTVPNPAHFVAYDDLSPAAGSGGGPAPKVTDGDAEQVELDLDAVPAHVDKVVFAVEIADARGRRQTFGDVHGHYIRVADLDTGTELARYDVHAGASTETAMVFGEIYRHRSGDWKFRAIGQGWVDGVGGIARDYGVEAGRA